MALSTLRFDIRDTWIQYDSDLVIIYIALGLILSFYGVSGRFLKFYVCFTEPMGSLFVGFLLGNFFNLYPSAFLDPGNWFADVTRRQLLFHLARLTLCIQLMSSALRLPRFFVIMAWKQLFVLLGFVMVMTAFTGALFSWLLFSSYFQDFSLAAALLVGALFCPTDPVVASATVSGRFSEKRLSAGFRHLVSAESSSNDGIAFPLVALPLLFLTGKSTGDVMRFYWIKIILYDFLAAAILAAIIGFIVGILVEFSETRPTDKESFVAFTLGFALLILGIMRFFDASAVFSVFVAGVGLVVTYPHHKLRHENGQVQESMDTIVTCAFFVLLGVIFPFDEIYDLGWRGVVFSFLLIFFRRPLWIFMSHVVLRPYVRSFVGEGLLYSYFAPMGVSTIFYGAYASETLRHFRYPDARLANFFWLIALEVAVLSTFTHGFTLTLATHAVGKFERHKASLYKFFHLPQPHPLRGMLELPHKNYQGREDDEQAKTYETRHSLGLFRNNLDVSGRRHSGGQPAEHEMNEEHVSPNHDHHNQDHRNAARHRNDHHQPEREANYDNQHSQGDEREQSEEMPGADAESVEDEEEQEQDEAEEVREREKKVWAGRPLVGIFESSFWCRFLYRVDTRDEPTRV